MTIRFTIKKNYRGFDIEIQVEASSTLILKPLIENMVNWLVENQKLIDAIHFRLAPPTSRQQPT